jgi:S1-C subfamily serine protease
MLSIEKPSIQSLILQMSVRGQHLATGTGFVVQDGSSFWLITNRHNLSGRRSDNNAPMSPTGATPDTVTIMHNGSSLGEWLPMDEPLLDGNQQPLWLEHAAHGRQIDVVALPLTPNPQVTLYPYNIAEKGPDVALRATTDLNVVGFPFGITSGGCLAVWTRGTIASEYGVDFDGLPRFLIDARTRQGQSGSPVIFYATGGMVTMADGGSAVFGGPVHRLVGVYSGRINAESDLGIVWRLSVVEDLVRSGVRPPDN